MTYTDKLTNAVRSSGSLLCVGLDPDPARIPAPLRSNYTDETELIFEFCRRIVEATKPYTCAFKPNTAFFEAYGSEGWAVLERLMDIIPSNRLVIADAKRGDIGNTASRYKTSLFDRLGADAVTLNPMMGLDTLEPFLNDETKAVYVLVMTSNSGAADFLKRRFEGRTSLSEYLAEELSKQQQRSKTQLGMVVGATQAADLSLVLKANPSAHLLIPGVGSQGGDPGKLAEALRDHRGIPLINSSRSVIFAGGDSEEWMEMSASKAAQFKEMFQPITDRYVAETA
jgi:orotidine-5'-phosphate decarboxylase